MKRKVFTKIIAIFLLLHTILLIPTTYAEINDIHSEKIKIQKTERLNPSIKDTAFAKAESPVIDLQLNNSYENKFSAAGEIFWFRIAPSSAIKQKSHIQVHLDNSSAAITIYPSIEHANNDVTHNSHRDKRNEVTFPLAWKGPYYIKIQSTTAGAFTISNTAILKDIVDYDSYVNSSTTGTNNQITNKNNKADKKISIIIKTKDVTSIQKLKQLIATALQPLGKTTAFSIEQAGKEKAPLENTYVVSFDKSLFNENITKVMSRIKDFEYIEQSKNYQLFTSDIYYNRQWSLQNNGQLLGKVASDINFSGLEKLLKDKNYNKTVIAVIDSGLNYELADFSKNVDTVNAFNFINNTRNIQDELDHGTHVAGIIAANQNNGYSMTGINQFATILPLKICEGDGTCSDINIARAIKYAVDKKAKVINLSLGGFGFSKVIEEQLKYAYSKGVTVVAASGNEGIKFLNYPARSQYVISVGATDSSDNVAFYSNSGKGLDLVAPGDTIPSLISSGEVVYLSGTSMATPHVSAVAGLLYSINSHITPLEIVTLFERNSTDLGARGYDTVYGYGRLNAARVVSGINNLVKLPKVNAIDDNDLKVTGTTAAAAKVIVKVGTKKLGEATANSKGSFSVRIPSQKAGTVLQITAYSGKKTSAPVSVTVIDKTPPFISKVNPVDDNDKKMTGITESYAKVVVMAGKKKLGQAKANSKGSFSVTIPVQKANTKLAINAYDQANNKSKTITVTVKDKTPPTIKKVNAVYNTSKTVTGTTEAYAKVVVMIGKKKLGEAKANSKGTFSVKISAQKVGAKLTVTAYDKANNKSNAKTITVKKK